MKTIKSWMHHYPGRVVFLTFVFTLLPVLAAIRDDWKEACAVIFLYWVGAWAVSVWRHGRKCVSILLIAALAIQARPVKAAAIAVGVVVVCVGGVCIYKVVKFCQKKLPPNSANTNSNDSFYAVGDEYGAAYEYSSMGSCYVPPTINSFPWEDLNQNPTTFTLNVMINPDGISTSMTAYNAKDTTQTWDEFKAEMAGHGLFLTGRPAYAPQFEFNGVPCDASAVPIEFDQATGRVTHRNGELRRVKIERSPDLQTWYPLLETDTGVGSGFKVVDTTREGQMFYRIAMGASQ